MEAHAQRQRGLAVPVPGFSLGLFAEITSMWRDYKNGLWPAPGSREDQNPNLLDAFAALDAAEAAMHIQPVTQTPAAPPAAKPPVRPRFR